MNLCMSDNVAEKGVQLKEEATEEEEDDFSPRIKIDWLKE